MNNIVNLAGEVATAARPLILILDQDADLLASVTAQLERLGLNITLLAKSDARAPEVVRYHDLRLDRAKCRVSRGGREIVLGPTEFRLLDFLIRTPELVYSRDQLLDAVWSEVHVEARIVDVYIAKLRRCLALSGETDLIRTVRGRGYALDIG